MMNLNKFLNSASSQFDSMDLPIPLGVDKVGSCVVRSLIKLSHVLVAGTSGSGKSTLNHSIISALTRKYTSAELKFLLVDTKMVELTSYKESPYLMSGVETEPGRCLDLLDEAIQEKNRRLKTPQKSWPYLVIIVDTFSDLSYRDKARFEQVVLNLTDKTFNVGIYLIICDSRFDPKLFTENLKQCFPSKICFKANSAEDSALILGQAGGENLLSTELLFLGSGEYEPLYLKVPVSDPTPME